MADIENKENQEVEVFEDEQNQLLEHDFDGIREFNNPPPPWLMWLFYITIIFAAFYWFNMQVFKKGLTSEQRYEKEMAKAEAVLSQKAEIEKVAAETSKIEFLTDADNLAAGEKIFAGKVCITCHGNQLEGKEGLGPNLTDAYWIHGNKVTDLIKIITEGNIQKGMTPYKGQLSDEEMLQVASYIWSKQGSNPENAKAPEGEKY